ncbi:MAG: hypothetical protein FJ317_07910, partial [SAR202 cluster bacterium]|nr:hypothetical protein [SAR202 cluster bacterium]
GISDIWITTQVIGAAKIARVCALARRAAVTVVVDSAGNVDELAKAARAAGVTIRVSVDIHTGLNGTGVEPGKPAVDLATRVAKAKGLEFTGFSTYEGAILKKGAALENESRKWIQMVLDTRQAAEKAGLDVKTVSAGGTHNYDIAASMKGVTEVPAGTYALLDERYRTLRKELKPAASVMASIISTPEPSVAVGDAGMKGCGNDTGLPGVKGRPDLGIKYLSAEHTNFIMDKAKRPFALGEKVSLIPWEIAVTCNLYDYIMAVRKDRLEAVLNVTARGRYR